ncbi:hypothetical protein AZI87_01605 [Bdellovibrio bacteriovorus]|uniref:Host attachment protein n=1 Tax=Bdellovibrio bacteriovorus TaxID=959 RepID=A0A162GF33_BDEBC|nr:host attachment protein [Bdellovibrio bacteriovorus]KYG67993.1 hypothetical protein AZI87_01605 [Bdellovibrio bacteriovorus]
MEWFLVANQREAKIFVKSEGIERVRKIHSFENPLSHEKKSDLIRKKAGRGVKSIGKIASIGYSVTKRSDPQEQAAIQFAREISEMLSKELENDSFQSLTVFAEPDFLGKIRHEMSQTLLKRVTDWVPKDLLKTPQKELAQAILG